MSVFPGEADHRPLSIGTKAAPPLLSASSFYRVKHSISQTEPAFLSPTLGAAESLSGTLRKLYLLFITCWRIECAATTLLLLQGLEAFSRPPGSRSARLPQAELETTKNFFLYGRILWILTTCSGCKIPVKLAKKKQKKKERNKKILEVLVGFFKTTEERKLGSVSQYFTCFYVPLRSFLLSKRFTMKNLISLGLRGSSSSREPVTTTVHCASNTNLTHHQTVIVQHLFMEDREINVI